jgi:hypothetical protein
VDDWLIAQTTLVRIPVQNWMAVTLALILVAAFIAMWERGGEACDGGLLPHPPAPGTERARLESKSPGMIRSFFI